MCVDPATGMLSSGPCQVDENAGKVTIAVTVRVQEPVAANVMSKKSRKLIKHNYEHGMTMQTQYSPAPIHKHLTIYCTYTMRCVESLYICAKFVLIPTKMTLGVTTCSVIRFSNCEV